MGGCATPGATPPPSADRASGQKGGVAPVPSLPAGAARVVRSRTKNPNGDSDKWKGEMPHPPPLFLPHPPPVSAWHVACPAPCHGTGTHGGHHQIAASGPVSRTVDQMWKRSIATRAIGVVGIPSGSWRSAFKRSTAVLNPPNARSN